MSLLSAFAPTLSSAHATGPAPQAEEAAVPPILIKRYRNRRLYDTGRSAYITLDDLAGDLASGRRVKVVDATSGEDLTRRTMVQVLLTDAHAFKLDFLPEDFLQTVIEIEDRSLMRLFGHYLGLTLSSFSVAQRAMKDNLDLMRRMAPGPSELLGGLGRLLRPRGDAPAAATSAPPGDDEAPE